MKKNSCSILFILLFILFLVSCSKATNTSSKRNKLSQEEQANTTQSVPASNEHEKEAGNNEENKDTEHNKAQIQVYEGCYFDEKVYGYEGNVIEDESVTYCTINISNVTDISFDFSIDEVTYTTNETLERIPLSTAYFTEDGTVAEYSDDTITLYFSFPGKPEEFPKIINVTGYDALEEINYINNSIPGHESG